MKPQNAGLSASKNQHVSKTKAQISMTKWNGKVVVVTGGSDGLGKSIVEAFAAERATVVIIARDESKMISVVESAKPNGLNLDWVAADVTSDQSVKEAFSEIINRHKKIDVLVNNVGASTRIDFQKCHVEEYKKLLEVNFYSAVRCTLAALDHLASVSGQVVNIGSLASKTGWPNVAPYSVSKHALASFSHQLRLEGPPNVNCLHVCTGPIQREDSKTRYQGTGDDISDEAKAPGAGVKIKGIPPEKIAAKIVKCCHKRKRELVIPFYSRFLFAILQLSPSLGDWMLSKFNKSKG